MRKSEKKIRQQQKSDERKKGKKINTIMHRIAARELQMEAVKQDKIYKLQLKEHHEEKEESNVSKKLN